jgi:hypothetical protein
MMRDCIQCRLHSYSIRVYIRRCGASPFPIGSSIECLLLHLSCHDEVVWLALKLKNGFRLIVDDCVLRALTGFRIK